MLHRKYLSWSTSYIHAALHSGHWMARWNKLFFIKFGRLLFWFCPASVSRVFFWIHAWYFTEVYSGGFYDGCICICTTARYLYSVCFIQWIVYNALYIVQWKVHKCARAARRSLTFRSRAAGAIWTQFAIQHLDFIFTIVLIDIGRSYISTTSWTSELIL